MPDLSSLSDQPPIQNNTSEQTVTMEIPVNDPVMPPAQPNTGQSVISDPVETKAENRQIKITSDNIKVSGVFCNTSPCNQLRFNTIEAFEAHVKMVHTEDKAGRPCKFCERKIEILGITEKYLESGKTEKPKVLFLNELAMILGIHSETILNWKNKTIGKSDKLEHPEFSRLIKMLEEMQELRLQQRLLGRFQPTGAMFLLKTKHNYIETEKRMLVGGGNEDKELTIKIVEDKKDVE